MLFRDQCVHKFTASSYIETDTTITSVGYRVLVDGEFVTEMRVLRNTGTVTVPVNCENLIEFNKNLFFAYLNSFLVSVHSVSSATKVVKVKEYELVFTKATGVTVATELGEVTMNDVIDGKFGNYFPLSMINQSTSKFVPLTNKFISGKKYYISNKTPDCMSIFVLASVNIKLTPIGSGYVTTVTKASGMQIISLNSLAWGLSYKNYTISIDAGGANLFEIEIEKSPYIDNLPQRRGSCYTEDGEYKNTLFVKHPYGGLDNIGNVNVVSVSGASNRQSVRLQDVTYIHGGSANSFETTTQVGSDFSVPSVGLNGEGTFSYSYEAYITNVNELWIAAMSAAKIGYLVTYGSGEITTIIAVDINSISASIEEINDGVKVWRLSVSCTQKVPFVA